jgi:hypothetical protein
MRKPRLLLVVRIDARRVGMPRRVAAFESAARTIAAEIVRTQMRGIRFQGFLRVQSIVRGRFDEAGPAAIGDDEARIAVLNHEQSPCPLRLQPVHRPSLMSIKATVQGDGVARISVGARAADITAP